MSFPNLTGKVHPDVEKAITSLFTQLGTIQAGLAQSSSITSLLATPGAPSQSLFHPEDQAFIRNALQANGGAPINVTNLIGLLAQPQLAKTTVNVSQGGPVNIPNAVTGQLQIASGELFYFSGPAGTGTWKPVFADAILLQDTYANWTSANYPPLNYPNGTVFFISDWNVAYRVVTSGSTTFWEYAMGVYEAPIASQPANGFSGSPLGTNDTGLLFLATDQQLFYFWSGSAWTTVPVNLVAAGTYGDSTHSLVIVVDSNGRITSITPTTINVVSALGYTPARSGANSSFSLTANLITGAVTGTITQT